MSEEYVGNIAALKPSQKGELKRYIKKLNRGNEGVSASSRAVGYWPSIQDDGNEGVSASFRAVGYRPSIQDDALWESSEGGARIETLDPIKYVKEELQFESDAGYDLDEPLHKALGREFEKLSSNQPDKFEKLLRVLNQHGVSDLYAFKEMPEEDVEKLDVESFQKGELRRYIKKLNGDQDQNLAEVLEQKIKTEVVREQTIGPEGGIVKNLGCKVTFPVDAVEKESKIKTSVITDFSGSPEGKKPITPILQCLLDSNLKASVLVEMHSWACPSESEEQEQGQLYRKDEGSYWKFVELVSLSSDSKISFYTQHFTMFGVFVKAVGRGIQTSLSLPISRRGEAAAAASIGVQGALGMKISIMAFLHINRDAQVAFVCCLSHSKNIDAVKAYLKESGYIHGLLMPEHIKVSQGGKFTVAITCHQPNTLKISENLDDVDSPERKREWSIKGSELLKKTHHNKYFTLRIDGKDLEGYVGGIKVLFSLKNGGSVEHLISKQWPIPK